MKLCISVFLLTFIVSFAFAEINVPDIIDNVKSIGDATIDRIDGNISTNGQRDVYSFTAPRGGWYRFEMSGLRGGATVRLMAWDNFEQPIANDTAGNGGGITLDLVQGQTYQIEVRQYSGFSPYRLSIGHQKETINISGLTRLNDSIQYTHQRNVHLFTAPRNGSYRFEMAELRGGARVRLIVWDRLDYPTIADDTAVNGQGITLDLVQGQTYQIEVRQYSGFSPYRLSIGYQKETVIINGPDRINDSIQYTAQRNVYTFTAPTDGRYRFEMAGLRGGARVRLIAWDRLDYPTIADDTAVNGQGITLNLVRGQTYHIQVWQYSGFSSYSLIISRQ